jgi:hypothetical protein
MSENPTREEVLASIVPKSNQLNADDLLTGPLTVTITRVARGDRDQPITVEIEPQRPYKPCKSMRRVLIATYGDDPAAWVGQQMTLFCDTRVMWAGVKVGGIRISHLSGLDTPRTFLLTKARGKKEEVTILPIQVEKPIELTAEEQTDIAAYKLELNEAVSLEELGIFAQLLKQKSPAIRAALRELYKERKAALSKAAPDTTED